MRHFLLLAVFAMGCTGMAGPEDHAAADPLPSSPDLEITTVRCTEVEAGGAIAVQRYTGKSVADLSAVRVMVPGGDTGRFAGLGLSHYLATEVHVGDGVVAVSCSAGLDVQFVSTR